jgi:nucleoside 2-deoxyribosyltransferase
MKKNTVYLAASLFSPFERERNIKLALSLEQIGLHVMLPQTISAPKKLDGIDSDFVFKECLNQLNESNFVVALVDGTDVDSGVAWELGYAFAKGIPIVIVRTDMRQSEGNGVNIMIDSCANEKLIERGYRMTTEKVVDRLKEIISKLKTNN